MPDLAHACVHRALTTTASDELDFDNTLVPMSGATCPFVTSSSDPLPRDIEAAFDALAARSPSSLTQGCAAPLGDNSTMWLGTIVDLNRLDGRFSLNLLLRNLTGTPASVVSDGDTTYVHAVYQVGSACMPTHTNARHDVPWISFAFQLRLHAHVDGRDGSDGVWVDLYDPDPEFITLDCQRAGRSEPAECEQVELLESIDPTQVLPCVAVSVSVHVPVPMRVSHACGVHFFRPGNGRWRLHRLSDLVGVPWGRLHVVQRPCTLYCSTAGPRTLCCRRIFVRVP